MPIAGAVLLSVSRSGLPQRNVIERACGVVLWGPGVLLAGPFVQGENVLPLVFASAVFYGLLGVIVSVVLHRIREHS